MPEARSDVNIPDGSVRLERVALQASAGVLGPPLILDEVPKQNATPSELVEHTAARRKSQVRSKVQRILDGGELLNKTPTRGRIAPPHAIPPDPPGPVPAQPRLDATRYLRLRWRF